MGREDQSAAAQSYQGRCVSGAPWGGTPGRCSGPWLVLHTLPTSRMQAAMTDDPEDDLQWLRYWVVLATVHMIELVVDPLVDFFPGYLLAKCAFLVWCMAPVQNNGANLIFSQVLFPLFKKHHGKIDVHVDEVQNSIRDKVQRLIYGQPAASKSTWYLVDKVKWW